MNGRITMHSDQFRERFQALRLHVQHLYREAAPVTFTQPALQPVLEGLDAAVELLELAEAELHRLQVAMADIHQAATVELQSYRELFAFAPEAYLVTGLAGTIHKANQAAARLFGVEEQFLVGRALARFVPEGQRRAFRAELARRCQEDHAEIWDLRMQPQDRETFDAAVVLGVVRDQLGTPQALRWLVRDITARKQAEAEQLHLLAETQVAHAAAERAADRTTRLQRVTAALAESLTIDQVATVISEQGVVALGAVAGLIALLTADGTALEIVRAQGYSPEVMAAWRRFPISAPVLLAEAVRTRTPIWLDARSARIAQDPILPAVQTQVGNQSWAAVPFVADGHVLGAIELSFAAEQTFPPEDQAFVQALTQPCAQAIARAQRYAAEHDAHAAAETAVGLREELLAGISHDLQNPLAVIRGQAQLLLRRLGQGAQLTPDRLRQRLGEIEVATTRMVEQVHELLDIARAQIDQPIEPQMQPTDLVALVRQIAAAQQQTTTRHRIDVVAAPEVIGQWDPAHLARVFDNLISNAIKYSPRGGAITITMAQEAMGQQPGAVVAVRDQGLGIPATDLPHIFDRFHRAANSAGQIRGTGLGLMSARQVVEQHGGIIGVESSEGRGSTFTVRLPLEPPVSQAHAIAPVSELLQRAVGQPWNEPSPPSNGKA
jgi:PAS domain S-box-containing protein